MVIKLAYMYVACHMPDKDASSGNLLSMTLSRQLDDQVWVL